MNLGPWKCPQCGAQGPHYSVFGAPELIQGEVWFIECDLCGWAEETEKSNPLVVLARLAGNIILPQAKQDWSWEAEEWIKAGGIYKNRQLSEKLLQAAMDKTLVLPFGGKP